MSAWRSVDEEPNVPITGDKRADVWVVDRRNGRGWRVTDCYRAHSNGCWINTSGKWFTGKRYWDGRHDVYDPTCIDEHSIVATHWMWPPQPPELTP